MNKHLKKLNTVFINLLFISSITNAHSPEEHNKKSEKPKCESMKTMDLSSIEKDDPVMQALLSQCGDIEADDDVTNDMEVEKHKSHGHH